ncbi:polyadenylate-binding protein 1-B-like [Macadamia integrifolia]|uniref:polyadenylate-binding protein 1-B-like n=1 Tax=Macadamia integrifolia TaxID=60698 RepID=UPI001C4E3E60|nr:polyadenylate-binding protein 1-B-like [Macadamia integrifolia]XP_042517708.1 polyadenylate-binding protein 1-B-like [Macadamia integrifolia]XP_042517709.1 polyadenylate-binding protein 1-B-like [Macadamia integrifolia]XP_042517710.1 polyadenylate-binding protein 1-B-like [Macadamia integrifolia]XP_042517712.1 polyadenylate-binding protein 1-B-like [Macadamia integrifolia]XP_042517713.1 polyadenylate-binding protein 1-B-like [Macadamia integrifolia]
MMEHRHPPLPACRASQPLASHYNYILCPHHHHLLHHDCHNQHHHLHHQHYYPHCHHRHHRHHHPFCGHHISLPHKTDHFHLTPCVASSSLPPAVTLPEQPQVGYSVSTQNHQNQAVSACEDDENSGVQLNEEWNEELEEEEEPVFVMTDEWVEFFAKSEAKRGLEKQQAKKKKAKK